MWVLEVIDPGFVKNAGPVSHVESFKRAAGTDLVAWSAGFCSLDT